LYKDCGRHSRENPQPLGYTDEVKATLWCAYQQRRRLRVKPRIFGVARNTVNGWLKKNGWRLPS
jgi:transposase-like protein